MTVNHEEFEKDVNLIMIKLREFFSENMVDPTTAFYSMIYLSADLYTRYGSDHFEEQFTDTCRIAYRWINEMNEKEGVRYEY
jgi:hypothetical protein